VRLELHPEADAEFAAQVEYYEDQQPGLGQRFYSEVIGCLDWIARSLIILCLAVFGGIAVRLWLTLFICDSNLPNRAGFFRDILPLTLSLPTARELPTPSSRYAARNCFLQVVG
jgi:hypothetical protein